MITKGWTLDDGLKLIRAIQDKTKEFGYHITLGGSILNKGESEKDLDLYFHPLNNGETKEDPQAIVSWLDMLWGKGKEIGDYSRESGVSKLARYAEAIYNPHPAQEIFYANDMPPQPEVEWAGRVEPVQWKAAVDEAALLEPLNYDEIMRTARVNKKMQKISKTPSAPSVYKFKLKFSRATGDRIDVFIL